MSVEGTLAERGARYGDFTDHAKIAQAIQDDMRIGPGWARLDDVKRQALTVIADKIARILSGDPNYADNWHDIQGYAKLVEDRLPAGIPDDFGQQNTINANHVALVDVAPDPACKVVEPAAAIDDDSPRMQAIAQNGNDGLHYHAMPVEAVARNITDAQVLSLSNSMLDREIIRFVVTHVDYGTDKGNSARLQQVIAAKVTP